jgi:hypothetical protein
MNKRTILVIISVLIVYGCKKENSPTELTLPVDASITVAKAYWQSHNITNYVLEQTTDSWYSWSGDSVRIKVIADTINAIISLRTNSNIDPFLWPQYKTVNQLFEIAEQDTSRYQISWELDTKYGYPKVLNYHIYPPPRTEGGITYLTYNLTPE